MSQSLKFTHSSANRYLEFNLGSELFAVSLLTVKEVIAVPEMTEVPFTPDYYSGIMNLRGTVISVIDLRKKLHIGTIPHTAETAVIIVTLDNNLLGVVVDSINRVLSVDPSDVSPAPPMEATARFNFIQGCYKKDKDLILFVDLMKLMNKEDREAMAKADVFKVA